MSIARKMTPEEKARGWCELPCGEHAWVFKAEVLRQLREAGITDHSEFCPEIQGPAAKLAVVQAVRSSP